MSTRQNHVVLTDDHFLPFDNDQSFTQHLKSIFILRAASVAMLGVECGGGLDLVLKGANC